MATKKKKDETITFAEYARRRGVSRARITQAVQKGLISTIDVDGKRRINPTVADAEWSKRSDAMARKGFESRVAKEKKKTGDPEPPEEPSSVVPKYEDSRAIREAFNARIKRLEYEEKKKRLIDSEVVREEFNRISRRVKNSILNIPPKIATELAAEVDPHNVEVTLDAALREALTELSRSIWTSTRSKK